MSRWFRWHQGTCEDGKFRVVARNARVTVCNAIALWAFLLEDAAAVDHNGIVTRNEDWMATILELEVEEVERILAAMQDEAMISIGHGQITVSNWEKRQFKTDTKDPTNAERQRRFREKNRNEKQTPEKRSRNARVTPQSTENRKQNTDTTEAKASVVRLAAKRGSRLPENWQPSADDLKEAGEIGLQLYEIDNEIPKFRDYWNARADKGAVKRDWSATWRNWCRKTMESRTHNGARPPTVQDALDHAIARARGDESAADHPMVDITPRGPRAG